MDVRQHSFLKLLYKGGRNKDFSNVDNIVACLLDQDWDMEEICQQLRGFC